MTHERVSVGQSGVISIIFCCNNSKEQNMPSSEDQHYSKRFASAVAYLESEEDEDPNYWREIPQELLVHILSKMKLKDRAALRKVSMTDKLLHRHTTILLDDMYKTIVVSTRDFYHELTRQLYAYTPSKTFPGEGELIPTSLLTKFTWREFVPNATEEISNMGGVIETLGKFLSSSEPPFLLNILEHLNLSDLFWSFDTDMDPDVLPLRLSSARLVNEVLTNLNLGCNNIGPEGGVAVGEALRVNGVLTNLDLSGNNIGGETDYIKASEVEGESKQVGAMVIYEGREMVVSQGVDSDGDLKLRDTAGVHAIAKALEVNGVLTDLNLYDNKIGPEGGVAIGKALAVNGVLTSLDVGLNGIVSEGAKAIGEALAVNGVLTDLDLFNNNIRDEGAAAIAEALRGNGVLKSIDLRYNELGDEGKGAIRDAVSGRVGFELEM